jgi:uncharacterized protein (TIRG00374 family)
MSTAAKRLVRLAISALIIALLIVFARKVDWAASWAAVRSSSPGPLALAALANLGSLLLKGVRWWVFLRAVEVCSLGLATRATVAGAGLNNVLVANGGDVARVAFISRSTRIGSSSVLATLAVERMFDLIGYVVLLAGSAFILPLPAVLERWRIPAAGALVVIVIGLVWLVRRPRAAAVTHAAEVVARADLPESEAPPTSVLGRVRAYGGRFVAAIREVSSGPRFLAAIALSLGAWVLQVVCFALTARAAHFPMPTAANVAAVLAVNLGLVVRATPGNVGFFQFVYALVAASFGLSKDAATGVAFLIQTLQIIPVTLLGVALAPEFVFRRSARPQPAR